MYNHLLPNCLDYGLDDSHQFDADYMDAINQAFAPAQPTEVFATYWKFAAERQAVFFRRADGFVQPWTRDPILIRHKFTNAYRASDRVSQYLISEVIYSGEYTDEDMLFRILLFKFFNRIATWELLVAKFGDVRFDTYCYDDYDAVLTNEIEQGRRIFSAAYIMPSGVTSFGESRKHRNCLRLLERMIVEKVTEKIVNSKTMAEAFTILRAYPMLGDFLAYQYVIDINYSRLTNFSENEFVVPGPGARDGIRKCFSDLGELSEKEIISLMAARQDDEFARLGIQFNDLWGRKLQLIDCQNLFCEVAKYARVAHPFIKGHSERTRIKQIFRPTTKRVDYLYPPKWKIDTMTRASSFLPEQSKVTLPRG